MDTELVNKITEQVIEALGQQGDATQPETSPTDTPKPTDSHPSVRKPSESKPTDSYPSALESRPAARVFITVDDLRQRLSGINGSVIELSRNEFLTPAAVDIAEENNLTISKAERNNELPDGWHGQVEDLAVGSPSSHTTANPPLRSGLTVPPVHQKNTYQGDSIENTTTIGLVIDRTDEKVRSVTGSLSHDGIGFSRFEKSSCWMENLRSMCGDVASGGLVAGVAILPYAADAMVLANKIAGIRAVQGTRLASVQAGLRHFGANVLILEHAVSTFHEMCTMIRVFTNNRAGQVTSGALLEAVGREERS